MYAVCAADRDNRAVPVHGKRRFGANRGGATPRTGTARLRAGTTFRYAQRMADKGNIYLIGPMGAGKTAVGKQLALQLGLEFLDADAEIERRTGVDIAYIFEKEGEAGFRERERNMIAELSELRQTVIATGGGAVLDPGTRGRLVATGTVIYLRTTIEEQLRRTGQSRKRPLLNTENPRAVLERLRTEREPIYDETADIRLDTTGRRVARVAATLKRLIEERRALQT